MRQCGETGSPSNYEEDHLISLELGRHQAGPRDLWPELHRHSFAVDVIGNLLHCDVYPGAIRLAAAKRQISQTKRTSS